MTRLARLAAELPVLGVDALLVTNATNVRYLSGFQSSNAFLVVEPERTLLLTDGRYVEAARAVAGVEVVELTHEPPGDLTGRLGEIVRGRIGFEAASMTVARHAKLLAAGLDLVAVDGAVERLRAVKEPGELDAIRASARVLDQAYERLALEPVVGRTEAELAWWLERTLHDLGAEDVAFDPIVASGPNAAQPHHHPGQRRVQPDETLLVDAGCVVDGYCSDCTRTFATGSLPAELVRAYELCLETQVASLAEVRAGAAGAAVDAVARERIAGAGYTVFHNLGHSLGLDIHEDPRLAKGSDAVLEAGNVVTVEPGVYLPGLGGIRIEDLVVVTDDGAEVLTPFTKELRLLES